MENQSRVSQESAVSQEFMGSLTMFWPKEKIPSMQDLPIQSAIVTPKAGSTVELDDIEAPLCLSGLSAFGMEIPLVKVGSHCEVLAGKRLCLEWRR